MNISASSEAVSVLINFNIQGNLRYLSHAETLQMLRRACGRAELDLEFTHGFNPRPKISLPFPRPVGVESLNDICCIRIKPANNPEKLQAANQSPTASELSELKEKLGRELPADCRLLDIKAYPHKKPPQPLGATYLFQLSPTFHPPEKLKATIERLMASDRFFISRKTPKKAEATTLDVRKYIKSIYICNEPDLAECRQMQASPTSKTGITACNTGIWLCVDYSVTPAGSIRLDEIMQLLDIRPQTINAPVKRMNIKWKNHLLTSVMSRYTIPASGG